MSELIIALVPIFQPPTVPEVAVILPSISKADPFQDNLGEDEPPNLKVPVARSKLEPESAL